MKYYHNTQDQPGEFFPMPKSIFRLGLTSGEILVYAYLMYCEDRKTYQCHPSYATIGDAIGCSKNSVRKYVQGLERKGLITTERTSVRTKDGRTHNGSLRYTLLPLGPVEEAYFERTLKLHKSNMATQTAFEKLERKQNRKKGEANENVPLQN